MNANGVEVNEITFEHVFSLAQRLRPVDQARLAVHLAPKVEWLLRRVEVNCGCFEPRSFHSTKTPGFKQSKV